MATEDGSQEAETEGTADEALFGFVHLESV